MAGGSFNLRSAETFSIWKSFIVYSVHTRIPEQARGPCHMVAAVIYCCTSSLSTAGVGHEQRMPACTFIEQSVNSSESIIIFLAFTV